jgi:hypothetical protein
MHLCTPLLRGSVGLGMWTYIGVSHHPLPTKTSRSLNQLTGKSRCLCSSRFVYVLSFCNFCHGACYSCSGFAWPPLPYVTWQARAARRLACFLMWGGELACARLHCRMVGWGHMVSTCHVRISGSITHYDIIVVMLIRVGVHACACAG